VTNQFVSSVVGDRFVRSIDGRALGRVSLGSAWFRGRIRVRVQRARGDGCIVLVRSGERRFVRSSGQGHPSCGLQWALPSGLRHHCSLACDVMTILELAERIDQRVAVLQREIDRLEAAKRALAHSSTRPAGTKHSSEPPAVRGRGRRAHRPSRAMRKRGRTSGPDHRGPKPAAARGLFRELDAGLRTHV